jgi:multidrug resistance efflux pump
MVENKAKPTVVEAEGKVALAHLPRPEKKDLQYARTRAAAGDQNAYEAEIARAAAWFIQVETEWNMAVQESKKNANELTQARKDLEVVRGDLAKANAQIADLKAEVEKAGRNLWTLAGVGLFVGGVVAGATLGWRIGGSIVACAPLAAAVPVILSSEYFAWIVGVTLGIAACLLLWRAFDYIKDKNAETK